MKQGSTMVLRGVIVAIGLITLGMCLVGLPAMIRAERLGDFDYGYVLVGLYLPAIPFFYALFQAMKLLGYIDHDKAFSQTSVDAFKKIKYCALAIAAMFTAGLPYIFHLADKDDAPGVFALGLVIPAASFVIATFAGVLHKLLQNAVDIKAENDLTV